MAGKAKLYRSIAIILIVLGIAVLAVAGGQRLLVQYNQAQLRDEFEKTAGLRNSFVFEGPDQEVTITEWQPTNLIIPAIGVELFTVYGDVFDKALLDKGPVHFSDIQLPDGRYIAGDLPSTEGGNVAFAGHRAGRWNFFLDIDQLEEGDEIYLDVAGYRFIYHVEWVEIFGKYDWSPILTTTYSAITLQTCDPKHVVNPDYRLMARGALYEVVELSVEAPPVN